MRAPATLDAAPSYASINNIAKCYKLEATSSRSIYSTLFQPLVQNVVMRVMQFTFRAFFILLLWTAFTVTFVSAIPTPTPTPNPPHSESVAAPPSPLRLRVQASSSSSQHEPPPPLPRPAQGQNTGVSSTICNLYNGITHYCGGIVHPFLPLIASYGKCTSCYYLLLNMDQAISHALSGNYFDTGMMCFYIALDVKKNQTPVGICDQCQGQLLQAAERLQGRAAEWLVKAGRKGADTCRDGMTAVDGLLQKFNLAVKVEPSHPTVDLERKHGVS